MKKEDLIAKGLSQEHADFVMGEYEKETKTLEAERDTYKSQADDISALLKKMNVADIGGLKKEVEDFEEKMKGKNMEIENLKADYAFRATLRDAIKAASGKNEKAISALLDIDALKASKNQADDIKKAIELVKKENDYLFGQATVPRVVSATGGINNEAQTKREQANEALRSLFGK